MKLTDEQWQVLTPHMPAQAARPRGGRPPADDRDVLDGIFYLMRTGLPSRQLPKAEYPSRHVCGRRRKAWRRSGLLGELLQVLAEDVAFRCGIDPFDPALQPPATQRDRGLWWWQAVLLLGSAEATAILRESSGPADGPE
jgi:transposase